MPDFLKSSLKSSLRRAWSQRRRMSLRGSSIIESIYTKYVTSKQDKTDKMRNSVFWQRKWYITAYNVFYSSEYMLAIRL